MADPTIVEITEVVTEVTVSDEKIVSIELTPDVTTVEVNNFAFPTVNVDAANVRINPYGSIAATNVADAIRQLADQDFRTATTPTGSYIEEGDTWYNTETNQFYVYREISLGVLDWVPIIVGNESPDSDTLDAGAF